MANKGIREKLKRAIIGDPKKLFEFSTGSSGRIATHTKVLEKGKYSLSLKTFKSKDPIIKISDISIKLGRKKKK